LPLAVQCKISLLSLPSKKHLILVQV
jgi:hypothetical protein